MAGVQYLVEIIYKQSGDLNAKLGRADEQAKRLDRTISNTLSSVGSGVNSAFGMMDSAIMGVVGGMAALGTMVAGGVFGAMSYGAIKVNAELEETQIAIAGILNAQGTNSPFLGAMQKASGLMADMRKDAAQLPGEFKDLVDIFQTIAIPGLRSGMDPDKLREFSAKTMAVGAVMRLPTNVTAREMAGLLEGRAGAHNILGQRLLGLSGSKATEFNRKSASDRMEILTKELEKYNDALEAYKHSFKGLSTTIIDSGKLFLANASKGLFDRIKGSLEGINTWFNSNQGLIDAWANRISHFMVRAFDVVSDKIQTWGPLLFNFAVNAGSQLMAVWNSIEPVVARVAEHLKSFLIDPKGITKAVDMLKTYAGVRIAAGIGGGILQAAGATGGAAGAAVALPVLAVSAVALAGALDVATDTTNQFHEQMSRTLDVMGRDWNTITANVSPAARQLEGAFIQVADVLGTVMIQNLGAAVGALAMWTDALTGAVNWIKAKLHIQEAGSLIENEQLAKTKAKQWAKDEMRDVLGKPGNSGQNLLVPNHTTNIHNLVINVTPNEDPSRVVRLTLIELARMNRNPKTSRTMSNFMTSKS